ncbi:MAG: nitroreductase [Erysipelotrichaceae bacterium]|nr:nitroreductase [Erysipelotrichaceae bacterium]
MNTLNIIRTRRSTRNYLNKSVEEEKLQQVLDAGRYVPSGGNSQTTHFIVITNPEVMETLIQLVQQEFAKMEVIPGMYRSMVHSIEASKNGNYVFQYHAPVLILTANQIDYGNNIADCACALENMMIMANALDLGSCWINQLKWLNENPIITEYLHSLGLDQTERVYGAMALGYADPLNRTPLKRKGNKVTYVK